MLYPSNSTADESLGPFELTKLSAQISVLMAKNTSGGVNDPVSRSYQQKGTFKTARNIVLHRGIGGLYSGFNYHLCKATTCTSFRNARIDFPLQWGIPSARRFILRLMRAVSSYSSNSKAALLLLLPFPWHWQGDFVVWSRGPA